MADKPCWCQFCKRSERRRFMIVCPLCGNKRCPHASHHDHECTDSNEPGQHGSVFGDYQLPARDMNADMYGENGNG